MHACTYTYMYKYTHIRIHTHIHTPTCGQVDLLRSEEGMALLLGVPFALASIAEGDAATLTPLVGSGGDGGSQWWWLLLVVVGCC